MVAAALPKPWPEEAVKFHLRWWSARERLSDGARPRRPSFVDLTGWTDYAMRQIMANVEGWEDPRFVKSSTDARQVVDKRSTGVRQVEDESTPVIAEDSTGVRQVFDRSSTDVQPAIVLTRVGSQSTEHRTQDTEKKPAPAPAVADLFTPASQPDAATGEATGDTAPPPGCAAPLPKPKRTPKAKPDLTADLARVLDALATLDPDRAQRARDGKNAGVIDEATKAIRLLGVDRIEARLRWAGANRAHKDVSWLLENQGWGAFFVHGKPMVNRMDDAAAMEASAPAGSGDARAKAIEAWSNMTMRADWQRRNHFAPNRPECFGAGLYDRIDLADDLDEHTRRFHCYVAAGSQKVWLVHAERERFKAAWIEAYARAVTL